MSRGPAVGAAVLVVGLVWWQLALSWRTCKQRASRRAMEEDLRFYLGGSHLAGLQAAWRASDLYRDSFAGEDEKAPPRDVVAWWLDAGPPRRRAVDPALEAELDRALSDRHHHWRGRFPEALGPEPEAEGGQASGGTPGPQAPDPATSGRAGEGTDWRALSCYPHRAGWTP